MDVFESAQAISAQVRSHDLSATDVISAYLDRIEDLNPRINAIPTLRERDDILAEARMLDRRLDRGDFVGPLAGLPLAVKDLARTKGIRTTYGSRIYHDFVPDRDEIFVTRLKAAGAIIIGKTNTPEFGAGSQTFNALFGTTRNPYDLSKTCGGSSGGAAAAVAAGMLPLADGSDFGGSLRNPAGFCNVIGFRPSPGRVPREALRSTFEIPVLGPIARTVRDAALLLSVMAGPDRRDPLSLSEDGSRFADPSPADLEGKRIAWSTPLDRCPFEKTVQEVVDRARPVFAELGAVVEDDAPDLTGAHDLFRVLRARDFAEAYGALLDRQRSLLKDTVIWNIEQGLEQTQAEVAAAEAQHRELVAKVRRFFERYDYWVLPTVQVAPFDAEVEWVTEIEGHVMRDYLEWMASCYLVSCTLLPAISVPCGFTSDGLPIGLQIVGRDDLNVLRCALSFEEATRYSTERPDL